MKGSPTRIVGAPIGWTSAERRQSEGLRLAKPGSSMAAERESAEWAPVLETLGRCWTLVGELDSGPGE